MKILSWNIHAGKDLEGVIAELKKSNADIICLQEVKNAPDHYQAEKIAKALEMQYLFCKAFTTDRHDSIYDLGNAILAKDEIQDQECVFLSTLEDYKGDATTEPRTAVKAKVGSFFIISTHLGYSQNLQITELQRAQLTNLMPHVSSEKCILAGDFNAHPTSETVLEIEKALTNTDTSRAPSRFEVKDKKRQDRIDYIFTSSDIKFKNFQIHPTQASDHSILTVEVE